VHDCSDLATHERILDAAERLFAEQGYNGTSLRAITTAARVNLAAVNYHFGDKESLYAEVLRRRLRPINAARLARLDEAIATAGESPPALEEVIDILLRPVFDVHRDPARGGPHIVRIIARSLTEPLPFIHAVLREELHPVLGRFAQVVRRHVPHLAPEDFLWRLSFVIGAMQHTLAMLHQMSALTQGICRDNDYDGALRRFISSACAVFRQPVPAGASAPAPASAASATET
jgi:AcrR family transcriptional regulator